MDNGHGLVDHPLEYHHIQMNDYSFEMLMVRSGLWSTYNATISKRYSLCYALAPTRILMPNTTIHIPSDVPIFSCHPMHA